MLESPCVASSRGVPPCVMGQASRSSRRRDRKRKVVIRHSIREWIELKANLWSSFSSTISSDCIEQRISMPSLSAGAPVIVPWTGVSLDEASFEFTLNEEDVVDQRKVHRHIYREILFHRSCHTLDAERAPRIALNGGQGFWLKLVFACAEAFPSLPPFSFLRLTTSDTALVSSSSLLVSSLSSLSLLLLLPLFHCRFYRAPTCR